MTLRLYTRRLFALAIAVLLGHTSATFASNYAGFRGGLTWSTLQGDEPADVSSVTRGAGGFVGMFGLTDWMYFQPELLWMGKGTDGTIPLRMYGEDAVVGRVDLNYLEIPLLFRFVPPLDDRWRPYFYGGPGIAANLSAQADATFSSGDPLPTNADGNIDQIVTDGDLLLMAGVGLDVQVHSLLLELDGRFERGLLTVDESRFSANPKTRTWSLSLGMLFSLGGSPTSAD